MSKTFTSPYHFPFKSYNGPDKNLYRVVCDIGCTDYEFIRSIRPVNGTTNTIQTLLWSKLVEQLKKHGITDITKSRDLEAFVANVVFVDGRGGVFGSTPGGNGGETAVADDRGGVKKPRAKNKNVKNKQPNAPGGNGTESV